ncbi:MAG: MBL fold metallo-hydrolase [Clostridiales bacterium]|nr:MBL fold metallo-hydrolase [Clostridiales bacterium]
MGLKICSLASGSRGNCIYIASDTTTLLIDAGISCKRIKEGLKALNTDPMSLNLLITHSHSDHIGHLKMVAKTFSPIIYTHYLTYSEVSSRLPGYLKLKEFDGDFYVGDITVSPFRVSHDVPCVGYSVICGGKKISVVTDVGRLTVDNMRHLDGSDVVLIESNHDENMLLANPRYAMPLKRRILSDSGHLSNKACAAAAVECVKNGAKQIMLGHLSQENNTPELAYQTTLSEISGAGLSAGLNVALQDKMSEIIEVC